MKGCAKFLNFIAFIAFLFVLIAFIALCAATAIIGLKPDIITEEVLDAVKALTINGQPITMEILSGFRIPVTIILGVFALLLLLTLLTIAKIRTALKEVGQGEPFSVRCSKALNAAAVLEVISGIVGIALSIYSAYIFDGLSANGDTAVTFSANLSFILAAVFLKMLSGISEFGRR